MIYTFIYQQIPFYEERGHLRYTYDIYDVIFVAKYFQLDQNISYTTQYSAPSVKSFCSLLSIVLLLLHLFESNII